MSKLSFYQQERLDGGVRTAITADDDTILHHFESGPDDDDPVLAWYVDVRCEGSRLPAEAAEAKEWFLRHAAVIRQGLRAVADELRAGIDVHAWPLQRPIKGGPRGVAIKIVCSVHRRQDALDMAKILGDLATHWEERIKGLTAMGSAVA